MDGPGTFDSIALRFAEHQHGVVSKRQLAGQGIPSGTIDRRVACGRLFPALRGVYSVGRPELSELGLWMASVLATGPSSVLGGPTAAHAHGFMRHIAPVCLVRPSGSYSARARLRANGHGVNALVVAHRFRGLSPRHTTLHEGIPILTVEVTLLRLAGELDEEEFKFAFWEADRKDLIDDERLLDCLDLCHGRKGGKEFIRLVRDRLSGVEEARSLLEVIVLDLIRRESLPMPDVNAVVEGHVVDFRWPAQRLVVETDGYEFHRGREAFERDRRISNELRAAGWTVLRFTYRMIRNHPERVATTIRKVLREGVA